MYPISYAADYVERRSRLTTFFRLILAIPLFIAAIFWGIGAYAMTIVAWFAIVFTGRYPEGLYAFNAKALRFLTRVTSYSYLMTDEYPSFGGDDEAGYPVRVGVAAPLDRYSRVRTLLRIFLLIPVWIMLWLYGLILSIVPLLAWIVIVITGRMPKGFQDMTGLALSYHTKGTGFSMLLTETLPPVVEEARLEAGPEAGQLQSHP